MGRRLHEARLGRDPKLEVTETDPASLRWEHGWRGHLRVGYSGASALAVGYHISLANLLAVNVLVSLFAGLMPLPSIGISEAAITAGLMAVGLPEADALAAAIIYRLCTYYLPPLWGYIALRWLTKNDFL